VTGRGKGRRIGIRTVRGFAGTVLLGLAGSVLATVAGSRDWASARGTSAGVQLSAAATGSTSAPLAVALGFVCLAAWGVVLVLRGGRRRAVAVIGAVSAAGLLAAVLTAPDRAQHDAVRAMVAKGATGDGAASLTGWFFACAVGALVALAAFVLAVAAAPYWPAMGSRYDAPAAHRESARSPQVPAQERTAQDMWRALDRGHDPTA
jgi:uncharacterized membrane protein (TIGR02234 family)